MGVSCRSHRHSLSPGPNPHTTTQNACTSPRAKPTKQRPVRCRTHLPQSTTSRVAPSTTQNAPPSTKTSRVAPSTTQSGPPPTKTLTIAPSNSGTREQRANATAGFRDTRTKGKRDGGENRLAGRGNRLTGRGNRLAGRGNRLPGRGNRLAGRGNRLETGPPIPVINNDLCENLCTTAHRPLPCNNDLCENLCKTAPPPCNNDLCENLCKTGPSLPVILTFVASWGVAYYTVAFLDPKSDHTKLVWRQRPLVPDRQRVWRQRPLVPDRQRVRTSVQISIRRTRRWPLRLPACPGLAKHPTDGGSSPGRTLSTMHQMDTAEGAAIRHHLHQKQTDGPSKVGPGPSNEPDPER